MTIEQSAYPRVTEILKITDTAEGNGAYELEIKIQYKEGDEPQQETFFSRPNDPFGLNPTIRLWLSQNPDAPVHVYVPPPAPTDEERRAKMPELTARQFRLGLVQGGISPDTVAATIEAMPAGPDRDKAKIEWEYATSFKRVHPLIATVSAELGLTDAQVDAMWLAAVNL